MEDESVVLSWEKHTFPNIVGLEEFRAKALIRYWLKVKVGYEEDIYFRMYDYKHKRSLTKPCKDSFGNEGTAKVVQGKKEVILWYDYKYDAVAITPVWFGSVEQLRDEQETVSDYSLYSF
jgi:hypothetical protein